MIHAKNRMYFDTSKAKIYKEIYRPSTNIFHLIRTLFSVILFGQSPVAKTPITILKNPDNRFTAL